MWRQKKINLWNYGIWCHFQVKRPQKRVLAKNYLLIVIPSRNIKNESLILPHINLSNFELVPKWRNQNKFWRVCMGCYQTLIPYISIGNWELIFDMRASLRILYKNMTSYPMISKNYFCDVINTVLYETRIFYFFYFCRVAWSLHTAGAPEIWIDQSGFSRRENFTVLMLSV